MAFSLAFSLSILPDRSSHVPITAPMDRLRINNTGYSLSAILDRAAFAPRTRQASPSASNIAPLYLLPIPSRTKAPKVLPITIVAVLTIIPSIVIY